MRKSEVTMEEDRVKKPGYHTVKEKFFQGVGSCEN